MRMAARHPCTPRLSTCALEGLLGRSFTAFEPLVGPGVLPITVSATIGNSNLVEISVNGRKRLGPVEIEYHLRMRTHHGAFMENGVIFPDQSAPAKVRNDALNAFLLTKSQR